MVVNGGIMNGFFHGDNRASTCLSDQVNPYLPWAVMQVVCGSWD